MYKREEGVAHKKSYAFALRIVKMVRYLQEEKKERVLSKQVLRSGTAVGALIREAEYAQSRADFVNKLNIALKEANETDYWLNLLKDCGYIDEEPFMSMQSDCGELIALLTQSVKTSNKRGERRGERLERRDENMNEKDDEKD